MIKIRDIKDNNYRYFTAATKVTTKITIPEERKKQTKRMKYLALLSKQIS